MVEVASLVLFSAATDRTVAFYRAIGLDLAEEDHGEGPLHFATEIDGVHVAVFDATAPGRSPAWQHAGNCFAGFYVAALDDIVAALRAQDAPGARGASGSPVGLPGSGLRPGRAAGGDQPA